MAHYLGLLATALGRFADADDHFASAAATQESIGAPVPLARTQLKCGRMLLIRNQPGDAERARNSSARSSVSPTSSVEGSLLASAHS